MRITLNAELEKFLDGQVKAGRFASVTEALEAGISRLMLDPEPDVLDEQDVAELARSVEQMRQGAVDDGATVHAAMRKRYLKS